MRLLWPICVLFGVALLEAQGVPLHSITQHRPTFRCDYTYFVDAEGWFKLHAKPATWLEAQAVCLSEGSSILYPDTEIILSTAVHLMRDVSISRIHTGMMMHNRQSNQIVTSKPMGVTLDEVGLMQWAQPSDWHPFICHKKKFESVLLNECGTVDEDYHMYNATGNCYKLHENKRNWFVAGASCKAEGGQLAIINSETEAEVIIDIFKNNPADQIPGDIWLDTAFLGFRSLDSGRSWITIDDETLNMAGYAMFAPGEPNNAARNEYCGSVGRNGKLFDDPCMREMLFICEKRTDEIICDENNNSAVNDENDMFTVLDRSEKAEKLRSILGGNNV
ncbi:uncharacterized protein LOC113229108 [Hyposmocoma kahamanoa]|uniref:uncharacterized protein LOC113229108 n=1 Tax=Hyposmocoma kahamanoa TaxID=1477025 RepID=UPI000E6D6006|nr:uncharacterized protein LOC113229108 [Hyposmocoma kahamanoa]